MGLSHAWLCCVVATGAFSQISEPPASRPAAQTQPTLSSHVDPRVELMSIIFRLAGNPEYNMDNSASPYADEVEAHFGRFRGHAVVQKARQLRKDRWVGYDAVMGMAIFVEDAATLKECVPLEQCVLGMGGRWTVDDAREFLDAAKLFVKDSDFAAFAAAHESLYADAAARMNDVLKKLHIQEWFNSFFGARPEVTFELILGLLNGGGCYGPALRYPDGREVYYSIIGCSKFDRQGRPVFSDAIAATIAHEFCHSYTNPMVEKRLDQLRPSGEQLFASCKAQMHQQAYSTWKTMMTESLVRACVIRYVRATKGRIAAWLETQGQTALGFVWVGGLADCLVEYEDLRDHYPTLDTFMPKVVEFFDDYARKHGSAAAEKPAGPDRVIVTPDHPIAGEEVKITYFAWFGPLAGSKQMTLHHGFDRWQQVTDVSMRKPAEETWEVTLKLPPGVKQINFVFTNGEKWDNNSESDWRTTISPAPSE